MDKRDEVPLQINGWRIYAHPLFLNQLNTLINEVETLHHKDPQGYRSKNASKRLAAIARLMLHDIPQDPARREFQQGTTLGAAHRHWHRAKFFQQYRLFFRFHARSRLIVLGWVNDTGRAGHRSVAATERSAQLTSNRPVAGRQRIRPGAEPALRSC